MRRMLTPHDLHPWVKGMVSTKQMQMQLRISKSNYEEVVEIMINWELNQMFGPVLHSVDLVMTVTVLALQRQFLKLFKRKKCTVLVWHHHLFVCPN